MLQEAVKHYEQWRITNDIYLSLFSFSKFIMYKDIEKYFSVLLDSPIMKIICGQPLKQNVSLGLLDEEKDLDGTLKAHNTFQILDADSSQQQAILAAKRGKNLLIEGPPGTGKSQTIANIISEFLSENKKVLFVSQKMAALEVVKKRLDNNGIGDFCLELHSRKANKNEVIKELVRVLEIPQKPDHSHDDEIAKLEDIKKALNDYVNAIHTPYGKLEMTPYQAFGIINKHQDINDLSLVFKDIKEWSRHKYNKCCDLLDNLAFNLSKIHNPMGHPWYGSQLTEIYYQDKININKLMGSIIDNYSIMQGYLEKRNKSYFYNDPSTIIEIETFIDINLLFSRYYRYIKNPFLRLSISFWKDHGLLKKHLNNSIYGGKVKEALDNLKNSSNKRGNIKFDIENYKSTIYALSKVLENLKNDISKLFEIAKFNDFLVFNKKFTEYKLTDQILCQKLP
jgi:DNA polymerase III delta prime subunit